MLSVEETSNDHALDGDNPDPDPDPDHVFRVSVDVRSRMRVVVVAAAAVEGSHVDSGSDEWVCLYRCLCTCCGFRPRR